MDIFAFVIVFNLALVISLVMIPVAQRLSNRLGVTSIPGGRRQEHMAMPKLGGLAIFVGFTGAALAAQYLPVTRHDPGEVVRLTGLFAGGSVIFLVGIIDDIYDLSYLLAFFAQVCAAGIAIAFQIFIEFFNNPLTGAQTDPWSPVVTVALTVFWLVLMMNTVNLLDGADGLAAGVALIAALVLFINSAFRLDPPQTSVSLLPLALVGALLGFLLHNFFPAQIYLGGSAWYLGFVLGALSIIGGAKMATILLVMGLPLMDLGWQLVNRLRLGSNPFRGDRGHLHFRLLDTGIFTPRQIALGYYALCAFLGFLTLVTDSQLFKFIALIAMLICIAIGFMAMARISRLRGDYEESSSYRSLS